MPREALVWFIVIVVIVGITATGVALILRRKKYIRSLTERGWRFVNSPSLAITDGLSVPPFGLGFARATDEQVIGATSAGVSFQVFDYKSDRGKQRLATMPLPFALPEFSISTGGRYPGNRATELNFEPWRVFCDETDLAQGAVAVLHPALSHFASRYPVMMSIDGSQLVALNAPKEAAQLADFTEAMGEIVQAVRAGESTLTRFRRESTASGFTFYRHPNWQYHGADDSFLDRVQRARGGSSHRAKDVVTGQERGITFIALKHTWQTTRTETSTDSNGHTTTRTVTDNHSEDLLEIYLPFNVPYLRVRSEGLLPNWMKSGKHVEFESAQFNRMFDVYADVAKFAYDVVHPRQIEYLMAVGSTDFTLANNVVRMGESHHDPEVIGHNLDVLCGFLERVPTFVWKDLAITPPSFTSSVARSGQA